MQKQTPLPTIAELLKSMKEMYFFRNIKTYCFSMSSNYNSRYKPAEVLWKDGKGILIRERETFEFIKQIMLP